MRRCAHLLAVLALAGRAVAQDRPPKCTIRLEAVDDLPRSVRTCRARPSVSFPSRGQRSPTTRDTEALAIIGYVPKANPPSAFTAGLPERRGASDMRRGQRTAAGDS